MNSKPVTLSNNESNPNEKEINILALFGNVLDRKYFISTITIVFMLTAITYVRYTQPIYQATAMLQVEKGSSSVPGFDDVGGLFESSSPAVTEIALLKSRSVLNEAVENLSLDVTVEPKLFPVIGSRSFRTFIPSETITFEEPLLGATSYAWGGEYVDVFRFTVPKTRIGKVYILKKTRSDSFELLTEQGDIILQGDIGQELMSNGFTIILKEFHARENTEFYISRQNKLNTVLGLQQSIDAVEGGKDSGIVNLSFENSDYNYAVKVLDETARIYVRRNVERKSAEAQKSLEFLKVQLPEIKKQLEFAENRFNDYQIKSKSINISLETQGVLSQLVKLETQLQELELKRLETSRKFKEDHPTYQGLIEQIAAVNKQKIELEKEVGFLPETQQELLRLKRDVEVSNQIYTMMLGKVQELDIVRAGTIGNVRIIDSAQVNTSKPVKPKKALIIVFVTLIGGVLSIAIVLIQKAMNRGVEDPSEIEALGLAVYASVPHSEHQDKLSGFAERARKNKTNKPKSILALDNPADLAIEALRSLRTSLHFAMMEAKNNIIAISGPSPSVGKSFISVNLATVLAQSGKKVLIIDADMRKGYLQTQFGLKWEDGLSDYLSGRLNLEQVTKPTKVEGLSIITRGQIPPNPSELLMHSNFSKLVEEVIVAYDIVIIDTPPILAVTDPAIVSAHTGTTLLVTRFGQNHVREIELTRNRFEQNGIDVKGVVFNGVIRKSSNAYGYYGYYNYEYKSDNK